MCDYKVKDLINQINKLLGNNYAKEPIKVSGCKGCYDTKNGRKAISINDTCIMMDKIMQKLADNNSINTYIFFNVLRNKIYWNNLTFKVVTKKSDMIVSWSGKTAMVAVSIDLSAETFNNDLSQKEKILNMTIQDIIDQRECERTEIINSDKHAVNTFLNELTEYGVTIEAFEALEHIYSNMSLEQKYFLQKWKEGEADVENEEE